MSDTRIIVFDGDCVLCSAWVGFVIQRDKENEFRFAAMQTAQGATLLRRHHIDPTDPVTFLLLEGSRPFTDSDAALRIVTRLGLGWRIFAGIVRIIPRSLRDAAYRYFARNRYRLFGRRDHCYVPRPEDAPRFL